MNGGIAPEPGMIGREPRLGINLRLEPRLDELDADRPLEYGSPLVEATIGGRPIVLARPDPRYGVPGEPYPLTVPITMSRLRRAYDIESGRATEPYVPSLVDDVPLGAALPEENAGRVVVIASLFAFAAGLAVGAALRSLG